MSRPAVKPPPTGSGGWLRWGRGGWLAAALGAACFFNCLWDGFAYDDMPIVRDNPRIRSLTNIPAIWLSDWWQPRTEEDVALQRHRDRLYRPLTMYTFALNYAIGGNAPVGYHAGNILLHAAVCLLVWRLAQRLFGDPVISNVAALVFAVHPLHCEAVANVVGRAEVLASLLLLLGLLVLLPTTRPPGWRRGAGAAVLFLGALFSKETAICYVPVALLVLHAAAPRPARRQPRWWLMHVALLLAPLAVYLPLRYVALEHKLLPDLPPYIVMNPLIWADRAHRWLLAMTILGHYVRLLVVPMKLSANYGFAIIDPDRGPELLTFVGIFASAAAIVALCGYARHSRAWRQLALLTALSVASYGLISNTVFLIGVSAAERLLYWPSVPMLLALIVAGVHLWRFAAQRGQLSVEVTRLLRICGLLLLAALGLRSVVRNADWSSNRTLFATDVQTYPQSVELNEAAANEIIWDIRRQAQAGQRRVPVELLRKADRFLEAALKIYPRSPSALKLRGEVLGMLGERDRALEYLDEAARIGPLDHVSRQLWARLKDEAGKEAAHVSDLSAQVTTRPADAALRRDYGEALLQRGHAREALSQLEEAVRLAPNDGEALRLLGEACAAMNDGERATKLLKKAAKLVPGDWRVHHNLAVLLAQREPKVSLEHAQEAFRLAPSQRTELTLAETLAVNKRTGEALSRFRQLLQNMAPDDPLRPVIEERIRDVQAGRP